jgi:hypothetical protein
LLEVCCKGLRMHDEERWVDQRGVESWLPWRCNKGDEGGRPSKIKKDEMKSGEARKENGKWSANGVEGRREKSRNVGMVGTLGT